MSPRISNFKGIQFSSLQALLALLASSTFNLSIDFAIAKETTQTPIHRPPELENILHSGSGSYHPQTNIEKDARSSQVKAWIPALFHSMSAPGVSLNFEYTPPSNTKKEHILVIDPQDSNVLGELFPSESKSKLTPRDMSLTLRQLMLDKKLHRYSEPRDEALLMAELRRIVSMNRWMDELGIKEGYFPTILKTQPGQGDGIAINDEKSGQQLFNVWVDEGAITEANFKTTVMKNLKLGR